MTAVQVRLVPATPATIDAELAGRLDRELGVEFPVDWPPEHHTAERLGFSRRALEDPGAAGWWLHYVVVAGSPRPFLAGVAGYKGPPVDGAVEIGYSVVPSWQRRGVASEAVRLLIARAWENQVEVVRAHTLPHLAASIGVLRRTDFTPAESPEPGVLAFELRRPADV